MVTPHQPASDVDRGWAWAIVLAVGTWNFLVGTALKVSGVFYVEFKDHYNTTSLATSSLGFTFGIVFMLSAPIGGYLADRLDFRYLRLLLLVSNICGAVALATCALSPYFWLSVVLYGGAVSLSCGLSDPGTLSQLGRYFQNKRSIASGIAFTAHPLSSIIMPPVLTYLTSQYSLGGAMLIFGGIWMHAALIPALMIPPRYDVTANVVEEGQPEENDSQQVTQSWVSVDEPVSGNPHQMTPLSKVPSLGSRDLTTVRRRHGFVDFVRTLVRAFRIPGVPLQCFIMLCGFFCYYGANFMLPPLAQELGVSKQDGSLLLVLLSTVEIVARVGFGYIIDRCHVPKQTFLLFSCAISGVLSLGVSFSRSYRLYVVYVVLYGTVGGSVVAFSLPVLFDLVPSHMYGCLSSLFSLLSGVGAAVFPPSVITLAGGTGTLCSGLQLCAGGYALGAAGLLLQILLVRDRDSARETNVIETQVKENEVKETDIIVRS